MLAYSGRTGQCGVNGSAAASAAPATGQSDVAHDQADQADGRQDAVIGQPLTGGVRPQAVLAVRHDLVHIDGGGGHRVSPARRHEPGQLLEYGAPGDRDDDLSAGEEWAREGFANVNDDLSTRTWLVRAERSTAAGANLKLLFSAETRRELARLLHRIEYSVALEESKAALRALCVREGIFSEYLTDFINEVCVHDARVHAELRELFENM